MLRFRTLANRLLQAFSDPDNGLFFIMKMEQAGGLREILMDRITEFCMPEKHFEVVKFIGECN